MPILASSKSLLVYTSTSHPSVALTISTASGGTGTVSLPLGYEDTLRNVAIETKKGLEQALPQLVAGAEEQDQRGFDERVESITEGISDPIIRSKTRYVLSTAWAKACADEKRQPLHLYFAEFAGTESLTMPAPLVTLISGGDVASSDLRVQAIMMTPKACSSTADAVRVASEITQCLGLVYRDAGRPYAFGDEGGYSTAYAKRSSKTTLFDALQDVCDAIERAGYSTGEDVDLAIDFAANNSHRDLNRGGYFLVTRNDLLSPSAVVELVLQAVDAYPVTFVEDPLCASDIAHLQELRQQLNGKALIVADDLLQSRAAVDCADALIVMPDRIGTLAQILTFTGIVRDQDKVPMASHRSSETEEVTLADLAVGFSIPFLKAGGVNRSDRTAKYNQLLRIAAKVQFSPADAPRSH